jgi:hypothetical protein
MTKQTKRETKQAKRETNGQYAYDCEYDRMCVCGHTFGHHGGGSPAVCIFYSLSTAEKVGEPGASHENCGCERFRPAKITRK